MKSHEPHTFCKNCNRVIGKSQVDAKGLCPDCRETSSKSDVTVEDAKKRRWGGSKDRDE